ncbi:MAG: proton-conducting transporter membrane subunit, partial [Acidimicrobiales bacterium]
SASLYYLFAYTFMVIGSFAVVTVLGRRGDAAHDISSYRGLARRSPALALAFALLLLAQAGVPFTTGLWAKLQVVLAAVDHQVPLAVIAMVSAAVAAFFYLRVAVLMYTPVPEHDALPGVESPAEEAVPLLAGWVRPADTTTPEPADHPRAPQAAAARPVWTGTDRNVATLDGLNAALLLDEDPKTLALVGRTAPVATLGLDTLTRGGVESGDDVDVVTTDRVRVPPLAAVAIGLCLAVTVVFGVWPGPLTSFAHHATLLFLP